MVFFFNIFFKASLHIFFVLTRSVNSMSLNFMGVLWGFFKFSFLGVGGGCLVGGGGGGGGWGGGGGGLYAKINMKGVFQMMDCLHSLQRGYGGRSCFTAWNATKICSIVVPLGGLFYDHFLAVFVFLFDY